MNISEYRVTMKHDGGTVKIIVTARSASLAVDSVVKSEGAPRRSARLVETRPLSFERSGDDTWTPVPGEQWGRVDDQPANVDVHTNPFARDPRNLYGKFADTELRGHHSTVAYCVEHPETYADGTRVEESRAQLAEITEELSRREDVATAVELWERLCFVPFVEGSTQGEYLHSTRNLSPRHVEARGMGAVSRMPNREELEALVLSDGEETTYPTHNVEEPSGYVWTQDTSPWSGGLRLYPITLTLISCGDYHGSDIDAANNRVLKDAPGVDYSEPNTGGMGSVFNVTTTTVGAMTSFENATDPGDTDREPAQRRANALEWLEHLVTTLEGLQEYGLLSEEDHAEYLSELAEQAWSDHLERDAFDMLRDLSPFEDDETFDALQDEEQGNPRVHDAYFGYDENEWDAETATSVVNHRHEDAVKHVARTVFGWNVP